MQGMRDVIRASLARSLRLLTEEDRLAAALPLVCGSALASHCQIAYLDDERTLHVRVDAGNWLASAVGMKEMVQHDLQRVAGVRLAGLHFVEAGSAPDRPLQPHVARSQAEPGNQRPARRYSSTRKGRTT